MFARSVQGGCSDSTAVLDRESNAFSSCAIMLLLRAAAAVAGASQRALYWRRGRESTPSLHVYTWFHRNHDTSPRLTRCKCYEFLSSFRLYVSLLIRLDRYFRNFFYFIWSVDERIFKQNRALLVMVF